MSTIKLNINKDDEEEVQGDGIMKSIRKASRKVNRVSKAIDKGINKAVYKAGDTIKDAVNSRINFASKIIFNNPGLAPYVKEILNKHGDKKIIGLTLARSLVPTAIRKIMQKLNKAKNRVLYHLYLIVKLEGGKTFILEKNERINIQTKVPKPVQTLEIEDFDDDMVFNDLIDGAKSELGTKRFLNYNASSNNCQVFISAVVNSNGMMNPERLAFIEQDTTDIFRDNSSLRKFSNFIVNEVAGRMNILVNGGEIEGEGISKAIKKTTKTITKQVTKKSNAWIEHVKTYAKDNNVSYKESMSLAKETYTK